MNAVLGQKIAEIRINKLAINVASVPLTLMLLGGLVTVASSLPHFQSISFPEPYWMLLVLLSLIIIHEALHASALICWSRIPWSDCKFGVMWKALMPYCHCGKPITVRAYRFYALFPLIVTGSMSLLYLFVYPSFWSAFLSAVVLAVCIGDVWVYCRMWRFEGNLLVLDARSEIGCDIFTWPAEE